MDVDCSGELALLAGRRYLALIKLNKRQETVKVVTRQSKWEVGTAEWNPHMSHQTLFAIACNQKAELIAWQNQDQLTTVQSLRAHTRIIGDLNWSPFEPNLLATCSVDNYTFIWDIRDCRRPALSLFSIGKNIFLINIRTGASKVRWNRVSSNLLATSNEGDVRIWDHRKNSGPLLYLAAHTKRILGLDWNPSHECQLATCSQECTVKFWDISNPRNVENINTINSAFPVWRAQYTPFGQGLITVVLPQLRRGENGIFLWNLNNLASPIHTFVGHTDVVLNFAWRKQRDVAIVILDREYQLVSWSKDHHLRVWKMDSQLQKMSGCDMEITDTSDLDVGLSDPIDTLEGGNGKNPASAERSLGGASLAAAKSVDEKSDFASSTSLPRTLQQEFSLVNINIPNVTIDEMDAIKRSCNISAVNGRHIVKLQMSFPSSYPLNSAPTFQFCKGTTVDTTFKTDLLAVCWFCVCFGTCALRTTSQHHVKRNRTCLEPCLRQLKLTLDSFLMKEQSANLLDTTSSFRLEPGSSPFLPSINTYGSFQDVSVPFPRTSGAQFCGVGLLVLFSPPSHFKRLSNPGESTPRSLSALIAYASNPIHSTTPTFIYSSVAQSPSTETGVSVSSYYYQDRKPRNRGKSIREGDSHGGDAKLNKAGNVVLYDVSSLLPLHRGLAESYLLNPRDITAMCAKNANAALLAGRKDLVQLWSIITLIANPSLNLNADHSGSESPWAHHPFGRKLLQSLMNHYIKIGDIQTVAMVCCVFLPNFPEKSSSLKKTARIVDTAVYTLPSGKWRLKFACEIKFHLFLYPVAFLFCILFPFFFKKLVLVHLPGGSPYHTIHPGDLNSFNLGAILKTSRSNSWSDSLDDHETRYGSFNISDCRDHEIEFKDTSSIQFLEKKQSLHYDRYKKLYAEILHRWGLLQRRTQILKFVKGNPDLAWGVVLIAVITEFVTKCQNCGKDVQGFRCSYCKNFSFPCAICHIAVKGASNFCLLCGHGGHAKHMLHWFSENDSCPRGCGCLCLQECNE
uniref:WDR59/RTC1-like RING zinc finger domain-containing protein n=1 Tax=Strigamia maritima TaxID=126957 RepID=T1J4A1_STRMM